MKNQIIASLFVNSVMTALGTMALAGEAQPIKMECTVMYLLEEKGGSADLAYLEQSKSVEIAGDSAEGGVIQLDDAYFSHVIGITSARRITVFSVQKGPDNDSSKASLIGQFQAYLPKYNAQDDSPEQGAVFKFRPERSINVTAERKGKITQIDLECRDR